MTEEEQGIFLKHAKKSEYGDIVEFVLSTGMRINEENMLILQAFEPNIFQVSCVCSHLYHISLL